MKPEIHPDYHDVIFIDSATGTEWTSRSTVTSKETREIEGQEVPIVRLEISAVSHPFWTGTQRELDADGKIDRFRKRYGGTKAATAAKAETAESDTGSAEAADAGSDAESDAGSDAESDAGSAEAAEAEQTSDSGDTET